MTENQRKKGLGAAARVTALASSIMDLHVRIALQEVDREKRRLISGGIFLIMGGILVMFGFISIQILLGIFLYSKIGLSIIHSLLILLAIDLSIAGIFLRIGGHLVKGPYLPETLEGLSKTTKAVFGK